VLFYTQHSKIPHTHHATLRRIPQLSQASVWASFYCTIYPAAGPPSHRIAGVCLLPEDVPCIWAHSNDMASYACVSWAVHPHPPTHAHKHGCFACAIFSHCNPGVSLLAALNLGIRGIRPTIQVCPLVPVYSPRRAWKLILW